MSDPVRNPASVTIVTMTLAISPTDDFRSIDMGSVFDVVPYMPGPFIRREFSHRDSPSNQSDYCHPCGCNQLSHSSPGSYGWT